MSPERGLVLALGNPLLDMAVLVPDDTLIEKYRLPVDGQVEVGAEQREIFTEVLDK